MWRTGITIGLGWLAMVAAVIIAIIYFVDGGWIPGIISLIAGGAAMAIATATANLLTRTVNQ